MTTKKLFLATLFSLFFSGNLLAEETIEKTTTEHAASTETIVLDIETTFGSFVLELNPASAPKTVANFMRYVDKGFYDNTLFHRVIPGFVIQGGGFEAGMNKKTTYAPVENESTNGLKNLRGSISMARTSHPHSATSQFFINVEDNPSLDAAKNRYGYAVFGRVTSGMETIDKIVAVPTSRQGIYSDVPKTPVSIVSIQRLQETGKEKQTPVQAGARTQ